MRSLFRGGVIDRVSAAEGQESKGWVYHVGFLAHWVVVERKGTTGAGAWGVPSCFRGTVDPSTVPLLSLTTVPH